MAGLPKLEMKKSKLNRRLRCIEKSSSSFHLIFSMKSSNAQRIKSVVKVIDGIDYYRSSLEILSLRLKTLDNSIKRII